VDIRHFFEKHAMLAKSLALEGVAKKKSSPVLKYVGHIYK